MIKAIQEITIAEGVNPRESTIVAGGGAAGINILPIARELGCDRVILPKVASALSASGMQFADIVKEETASLVTTSDRFSMDGVNRTLAALEDKLKKFVATLGARAEGTHHIEFLTEARYLAQVWELETPLSFARFRDQADVDALVESFHKVHERVFAMRDVGSSVECVNWKARLVVKLAAEVKPGPTATRDARADAVDHPPLLFRRQRAGRHADLQIDRPPARLQDRRPRHRRGADDAPSSCSRIPRRPSRAPATTPSASIDPLAERGPTMSEQVSSTIDPVLTAVIANRIDGVVREMTNTLLRAAWSSVINSARDFSCAIATGDNQLLGLRRGTADPHLRRPQPGAHHDRVSCRPRRGRRVPAQRSLFGQHAPGRPLLPGAGILRGRAPLHGRRQGAPGRYRQLGSPRPITPAPRTCTRKVRSIFPAVRIQRNYRDDRAT